MSSSLNLYRAATIGALDDVRAETLEALPDAVVVSDDAGRVIWLNRHAVRMFGYPLADIAGKPMKDLLPVPSPAARVVEDGRFRQNPAVQHLRSSRTARGVHRDGSQFPVEVSLSLMPTAGRTLVVATVRRTADWVALRDQLRRAEEQYRDLIESAPDGVCELDDELRFVYVSGEMARQVGRSAAELIGQPLDTVVPAAADAVAATAVHREVRGPDGIATDVGRIEVDYMRDDGSSLPAELHVRPLRARDGEVRGFLGISRDVARRKQFERELRESREHLDFAQRVGKIGSSAIDLETGASQWSEQMFDLLGLDRATTVPGPDAVCALVHPDDLEELKKSRIQWTAGMQGKPVEARIRRPDGEERWIYVEGDIIAGPDGAPKKVITTFQDITERKNSQSARETLERQLMQAQKMEAVGRLTGGVAHDFNNLLSVISGRLGMLWEELDDRPDLREWIRICTNAATRGATLVRSMLAFSRQQPLASGKVDVAAIVNDLMEMLPRTLSEVIAIETDLGGGGWWCDVDPSQLQNALLNLALNARDAMPDGGKLTIKLGGARIDEHDTALRHYVKPGDYVVVAVADTGVGMSPEVQARIFEPFFTTKEAGKGSGLGLSMVYGFIKQSGGHVNVYSEPGHGTVIRIYLPRCAAPEGGTEVERHAPIPQRGSETVVVVEDDPDMRTLTIDMLGRLGYRALAAADAAEAIPALQQHPEAALLLTDLTLPGGVSGRELGQRAIALRPGLKIAYMSGYARGAIPEKAGIEPHEALLEKPFSMADLADAVRAALGAPALP